MVKLICSRCSVVMKNLDGGIKLSQYKYSKKRIETIGHKFVQRNHLSQKCVGYYCPKCWKIAKNVKVDYLGTDLASQYNKVPTKESIRKFRREWNKERREWDKIPIVDTIPSGLPDKHKFSSWNYNYEHKPTTVTFSGKDGKTRTVTATKIVPKKKVWTKQDAKKNREFYARMFSKSLREEE